MSLTKAGRYEIQAELGRGAMGVVYRGFDPTIGRTVAIKTVPLDAGDPELLKRFRREAQAAGILSHPNIVTIYDAGEDQGLFYIAMELVEGETLQKMMAHAPLPLEQIISLVEQVGAGLDHAHGHRIIHRDIKPANVIVSAGHAKVMDFGIAKMAGAGITTTGQVIGTPSYMAPEAVKGLTMDARADIFSLGVVLYEMLTGAKPFAGDTITSVIYKIIGEQPDPPGLVNVSLDPGLNYVVLKALAKNPAGRHRNCAELTADLKNYHAHRAEGKSLARAARAAAAAMVGATATASAGDIKTGTVALDRAELPGPPPAQVAGSRPAQRRSKLLPIALAVVAVLGVAAGTVWKMRKAVPPGHTGAAKQVALPAPAPPPAAPAPIEAARVPAAPAAAETAQGKKQAPATQPLAKAPAPPAKAEIEFQVSSTSDPAAIRIDGRERPEWQTPYGFKLPVGRHTIEVQKQGFRPAKREVEFTRNGPRSVMLELTPLQASVEVFTNPAGAEVFVDGQRQSALTPSAFSFSYGEHKVSIRKPGYHPIERVVSVGESTPPAVRVNLAPIAAPQQAPVSTVVEGIGRVAVRTEPRGAYITVDGKGTEYRTPVNFVLAAGKHTITVEHRGYAAETREIVVRKDQITDLELVLNPEGEKRRRFIIR